MFRIGDNIDLLREVGDGTVDMVYMDPPYNTGRNFHDFDDRFTDYQSFMRPRIAECHRVLNDTGNLIVHVEPKVSHHIRVLCDEYFGARNFRNEIVWFSGGNAKCTKNLGRNHDTIIVYGKTSKSQFHPMYKEYDEEYKKKLKYCDVHKKHYSTSAAHNSQPHVNPRPNLTYEWNGHTKQWYLSREKMQTMHDDGRLEYNARGVPRIKRFMEEMDGVPVRDTWDDISSIQGTEKRDYATQKPVKLLERIVRMYSSEGDLCLDPFAGSGTTGRACATLGRRCVMFDKNPKALDVFNTK